MDIALFIIGVFLIAGALINHTQHMVSKVLFKVIPFFSGLYCMFYAAVQAGWISI